MKNIKIWITACLFFMFLFLFLSLPITSQVIFSAVKILDSGGSNKLSVDSHGSAHATLYDSGGTEKGTLANPIFTVSNSPPPTSLQYFSVSFGLTPINGGEFFCWFPSANKNVFITGSNISIVANSFPQSGRILWYIYSAAPTGGTASAAIVLPLNGGTATSTADIYTVTPTGGTIISGGYTNIQGFDFETAAGSPTIYFPNTILTAITIPKSGAFCASSNNAGVTVYGTLFGYEQ